MKEILDKFTTWVFVFIFGIVWFFTTKYYEKPKNYLVLAHDKQGNKFTSLEIRSSFSTQEVAYSYFKDYQIKYPSLNFSIEPSIPKFKRRVTVRF